MTEDFTYVLDIYMQCMPYDGRRKCYLPEPNKQNVVTNITTVLKVEEDVLGAIMVSIFLMCC